MASVSIGADTFDSNGAGSTSPKRAEVNLDASGSGAGTTCTDIFERRLPAHQQLSRPAGRGFLIDDNVVNGQGTGNCVGP